MVQPVSRSQMDTCLPVIILLCVLCLLACVSVNTYCMYTSVPSHSTLKRDATWDKLWIGSEWRQTHRPDTLVTAASLIYSEQYLLYLLYILKELCTSVCAYMWKFCMSRNRHRCSHIEVQAQTNVAYSVLYKWDSSAVTDTHTHTHTREPEKLHLKQMQYLPQTQTCYQRCLTSAVHCEDQKHSDEEEKKNEGQTRGSLVRNSLDARAKCVEVLVLFSLSSKKC